MAWIWAALMPHPPVLVPQVGRGREREAAATLAGLEALCNRLREPKAEPDFIFVLSPHLPYAPGALAINTAEKLTGSLALFGAPQVAPTLRTKPDLARSLAGYLRKRGIPTALVETPDLTRDHGSLVPLFFLSSCFSRGLPPVITASPTGLSPQQAHQLGKALAEVRFFGAAETDRHGEARPSSSGKQPKRELRGALLAGGDLSHRLLRDGPNGFHPDGARFDEAVVEAVKTNDAAKLLSLPASVFTNAGECGLRSVLAMLGLACGDITFLSYEGPFGVGYCNALWSPAPPDSAPKATTPDGGAQAGGDVSKPSGHPYPTLARETVRRLLVEGRRPEAFPAKDASAGGAPREEEDPATRLSDPDWHEESACFVSIKTQKGDLRGCIGTILPTRPRLMQEIMHNAVAAATGDPRFPPMRADELEGVVFSVDVLSRPEPIKNIRDLDPRKWGVIVTKGGRRGLLLPDLDGVDTVQQQLTIAMRKGGITDLQGAEILRFTVERYPEGDE